MAFLGPSPSKMLISPVRSGTLSPWNGGRRVPPPQTKWNRCRCTRSPELDSPSQGRPQRTTAFLFSPPFEFDHHSTGKFAPGPVRWLSGRSTLRSASTIGSHSQRGHFPNLGVVSFDLSCGPPTVYSLPSVAHVDGAYVDLCRQSSATTRSSLFVFGIRSESDKKFLKKGEGEGLRCSVSRRESLASKPISGPSHTRVDRLAYFEWG
jgi:hypothetical protein